MNKLVQRVSSKNDPTSARYFICHRFLNIVFFLYLKTVAGKYDKNLVGGFNPSEKYARRIRSFPQFSG